MHANIYMLDKFLEEKARSLNGDGQIALQFCTPPRAYETEYPSFTWHYIDTEINWNPALLFSNSTGVCPVGPR